MRALERIKQDGVPEGMAGDLLRDICFEVMMSELRSKSQEARRSCISDLNEDYRAYILPCPRKKLAAQDLAKNLPSKEGTNAKVLRQQRAC